MCANARTPLRAALGTACWCAAGGVVRYAGTGRHSGQAPWKGRHGDEVLMSRQPYGVGAAVRWWRMREAAGLRGAIGCAVDGVEGRAQYIRCLPTGLLNGTHATVVGASPSLHGASSRLHGAAGGLGSRTAQAVRSPRHAVGI